MNLKENIFKVQLFFFFFNLISNIVCWLDVFGNL